MSPKCGFWSLWGVSRGPSGTPPGSPGTPREPPGAPRDPLGLPRGPPDPRPGPIWGGFFDTFLVNFHAAKRNAAQCNTAKSKTAKCNTAKSITAKCNTAKTKIETPTPFSSFHLSTQQKCSQQPAASSQQLRMLMYN